MKLLHDCIWSHPITQLFLVFWSFEGFRSDCFTFISCVADAGGLLGAIAAVTASCELPQASGAIGTHAGAAVVT